MQVTDGKSNKTSVNQGHNVIGIGVIWKYRETSSCRCIRGWFNFICMYYYGLTLKINTCSGQLEYLFALLSHYTLKRQRNRKAVYKCLTRKIIISRTLNIGSKHRKQILRSYIQTHYCMKRRLSHLTINSASISYIDRMPYLTSKLTKSKTYISFATLIFKINITWPRVRES